MKVYIYTQAPKESYYLGIKYLKEKGKIDSYEIINIKAFRKLVKNILITFGLLKNKQRDEISLRELIARTLAPVSLLFRKNIILGIEPYDWIVIYGLLLKKLRKNLIYYTSWPYWLGDDYPKKALPGAKFLWRIFLKNLKVISITKNGTEQLKRMGAKVTRISHPVDNKRFYPSQKKRSSPIKVLSVARLEERKGLRELVQIAREKRLDNAQIIICGAGSLREELILAAKKIPNFYFYDYDDTDLPALYRSADIFVLNSYKVPGWEELFGMVILEAMSSGLPVVSTDCIGPKEIIKDGVFGFLVPQKDLKILTDKLRLLLRSDHLAQNMGKKAKIHADKFYNLDIVAQKWYGVIRS